MLGYRDKAEEAIYNEDVSINEQWNEICSQLKMEFGETAFDSWLKPLSVSSFDNGVMSICAPTAFMKNWVIAHYSDRIHRIWERKNPDIKQVQFVVQNLANHESSLQINDTSLLKKIKSNPTPQNFYGLNSAANTYSDNEYFASKLNPAYTFDNFVVGKTNEFAYAAARKVAESKTFLSIRCFYIPVSDWVKPI